MKTTKKETKEPKKTISEPNDSKGKTLVVVESPSKAKTINKYLGQRYIVEASVDIKICPHINLALISIIISLEI